MKLVYTFTFLLSFFINLNAQVGGFYGVTFYGGENDGAIYKTDFQALNPQLLHSFQDTGNYYCGFRLNDAIYAGNNIVYGVSGGGKYNYGVLFEYNIITKKYTKRHDFSFLDGVGALSIAMAADSNIYGIAGNGGTTNGGTLFQFNPVTKVFVKKYDFVASGPCLPEGNIIFAPNGKLYGTTRYQNGTYVSNFFDYSIATNSLTFISNLSNLNLQTTAGLTLYNDTIIYGVVTGGTHSYIFKHNINSAVTNTVINLSSRNIKKAKSVLTKAPNGKMYSLSEEGGTYNRGTLYELDPNVHDSVKIDVAFTGTNGQNPISNLLLSSTGRFYGISPSNTVNYTGSLFSYKIGAAGITHHYYHIPNYAFSTVRIFDFNNSNIYFGDYTGDNYKGYVSQIDTTTYIATKQFDFGADYINSPVAGLAKAKNGLFYGVTEYNTRSKSSSILYEFNPYTKQVIKKIDLKDLKMISNEKTLTPSDSGFFFIARRGPTQDSVCIFEYLPQYNTIKMRCFISTGAGLAGSELTLGPNGNFYGLCNTGLYQFNPSTYTISVLTGVYGTSKLTLASNNKMYFVDEHGGVNFHGALYEYDPALNTSTKKKDFLAASTGSYLICDLVDVGGKIYGTATYGGTNSRGTIFEYNYATGVFTVRHNFTIALAGSGGPKGSLHKAASGKIYGFIDSGTYLGYNSSNQIYEFNATTFSVTTRSTFTGAFGVSYKNPKLLELPATQPPAFSYLNNYTYNLCEGSSISLELNSPNSTGYQWFRNGVVQPAQIADSLYFSAVTPLDSGNWHCVLQNSFGATISPSIRVNIYANPTISVTASTNTICQGENLTLTANGASSYEWDNGIINNQPFQVNVTDSFTVVGENMYGCKDTSGIKLTINPKPIVAFNNTNTAVCLTAGTKVPLNGGSPAGGIYSGNYCVNDTIIVDDVIANWGSGPIVYTYNYLDPVTTCSASATSTVMFSYCTLTTFYDVMGKDYKIYPNPGTGLYSVELSSEATIIIISTLGEIVYEKKAEKGYHSIDLSNNSNGIYFVNIKNEKQHSFKIVKQ
jgi:uncharacterized repeat protein (TIGR03803 family)